MKLLYPEDDAATEALHDGWRIPKIEEWRELMTMCRWDYVDVSGKEGYVVTSLVEGHEQQSIFLPVDSMGGACYWSATVYPGHGETY